MFVFTRSQIRQFRAVLRRSKIGKQSVGVTPRLMLVSFGDRYVLQAMSDTVSVELSVPSPCPSDQIVLPLDLLNTCEGHSDDPVTIRRLTNERISVEWIDQRIPQVREYDSLPADDVASFPGVPKKLISNPPGFWKALRDAVGSAEQTRTRYALDCLQLRGQTGQIAATDGQQALAQSGCNFPWTNDVLIPALPDLECRELPQDVPVSIGRDVDWATLLIGSWKIALKVEKDAHFPIIDDVFPLHGSTRSRMNLDDADARFLMSALSRLPGEEEHNCPVTVELNGHVIIRERAADDSPPTELVLSHSKLRGEPVRWQTNRNDLNRAVQLGFREVCLTNPDSPVLCLDDQRQFAWAVLDSKSAIASQADAVRIESTTACQAAPSPKSSQPMRHVVRRVSIPGTPRHPDSADSTSPNWQSWPEIDTIAALIENAKALKVSLPSKPIERPVMAPTEGFPPWG